MRNLHARPSPLVCWVLTTARVRTSQAPLPQQPRGAATIAAAATATAGKRKARPAQSHTPAAEQQRQKNDSPAGLLHPRNCRFNGAPHLRHSTTTSRLELFSGSSTSTTILHSLYSPHPPKLQPHIRRFSACHPLLYAGRRKKMGPKKAVKEDRILLGRPGNNLKSGIVSQFLFPFLVALAPLPYPSIELSLRMITFFCIGGTGQCGEIDPLSGNHEEYSRQPCCESLSLSLFHHHSSRVQLGK